MKREMALLSKACSSLAGWLGVMLSLASTTIAWANHVHMHGGPFLGVVLSVAVDPTHPLTLYAAAHGGGVFRSQDGGESWVAFNTGLPDRQVFTLLLHPNEPNTIYVGTDQGVFQRTNQNSRWRLLTPTLEKRNIRYLAADPIDSDLLCAATDQGVFSGKSGQWRNTSKDLLNRDVRMLAISSQGTIFAGTFGGIFKKNKGESGWKSANEGLVDKRVRALAIHPSSPDVLYAGTATGGVFKTSDGGKSWREFNRGLLNSTVLSLNLAPSGEDLYAGTVDGIFKSRTGADQWLAIGPELPFTVATLSFDPTVRRRLYAGSGGRLFKSSDAGQTWREIGHKINYFGPVPLPTKPSAGRVNSKLERR